MMNVSISHNPFFGGVRGVLESRLGHLVDDVIGESWVWVIEIGCYWLQIGCISNLNPPLMQMESAEGESVVNLMTLFFFFFFFK